MKSTSELSFTSKLLKIAKKQPLPMLFHKHTTQSTNDDCRELLLDGIEEVVCIADEQSKGRGQKQRTWQSPKQSGLYFSFGKRLNCNLQTLQAFSLTTAVICKEALQSLGVDISIKWPNDLIFNNAKLGGILVETEVEAQTCCIIIGIGINLNMPTDFAIDKAWSDLSKENITREFLAFELIKRISNVLTNYTGFAAYKHLWLQYCMHLDKQLIVNKLLADGTIDQSQVNEGICKGIDDHGNLLVNIDSKTENIVKFSVGEVKINNAN